MFWTFKDDAPVRAGVVVLDGATGHHLARVLRVRPGERGVVVSEGRENEVEVIEVRGARVVTRITGERRASSEPDVDLTVLLGALPNPDVDAVIESGTAVGISGFLAVQADRSVARPPASRISRWQTIAQSAAEQSHRDRIPRIGGPMPLPAALDEVTDSRLLILDPPAVQTLRSVIDGSRSYAIAVGPEGGWTPAELAVMHDRGGIAVTLGPRILRARLAPIVAAAILVQQS